MQGRLRKRPLVAKVDSKCVETGKALQMVVDSELGVELLTQGVNPVVSIPMIDLKNLGEDVIYNAL